MDYVAEATKRKVLVVKARIIQLRGDESAFEIYRKLAANRRTAEGAESYYYLVEQQYQQGNDTQAEQMVYDLGECGSVYWQAKCFILLGDIMRDRGNTFQARATYQSIVDGYSVADDGIIDEVKSRINSL